MATQRGPDQNVAADRGLDYFYMAYQPARGCRRLSMTFPESDLLRPLRSPDRYPLMSINPVRAGFILSCVLQQESGDLKIVHDRAFSDDADRQDRR